MKFIKILFLLIWTFFISTDIYSQVQNSNRKWGLGVDMLSLGEWNDFPRYSLFGTREIGARGLAIRARVGGEYSTTTNQFPLPLSPVIYPLLDKKIFSNFFAMVGVQRNIIEFSKNSTLYMGLDIFYSKQKETLNTVNTTINEERTEIFFNDWYYLNRDVGANLLFGYSWFFFNSIELRFESALGLGRHRYIHYGENFILESIDRSVPFEVPNLGIPLSYVSFDTSTNYFKLNSFNQILLIFRF